MPWRTVVCLTLIYLVVWTGCSDRPDNTIRLIAPIVISTWDNVEANKTAASILGRKQSALDAVEGGIRVVESKKGKEPLRLGGLRVADRMIAHDASVMDDKGNAGSVTCLKNINHPISVARLVMDSTDHIILSGEGAHKFAIGMGFNEVDLLTEKAQQNLEGWKRDSTDNFPDDYYNFGMLAMDEEGNISGGCSSGGVGFKLEGRIGDCPLIGAGLYVDNAVGGAAATGQGEEVIKEVGSFLVVELMRNGLSPQRACEMAIKRIKENNPGDDIQVGFIALNKNGQIGAYSIYPGFEYTVTNDDKSLVYEALSYDD